MLSPYIYLNYNAIENAFTLLLEVIFRKEKILYVYSNIRHAHAHKCMDYLLIRIHNVYLSSYP